MWHGESDIATYDFEGGFRADLGSLGAMFDGKYGTEGHGYFHTVSSSGERGVNIQFLSTIQYVDLEIHTRRNCCADRYRSVCLYNIDENGAKHKISCTPADFGDQGKKGAIHFKDFNIAGSEVVGTTFHLRFEDVGDKGWGAIEELFFSYTNIPGNNLSSTFVRHLDLRQS